MEYLTSAWVWLAIYLACGVLLVLQSVWQDFYNKAKGHRIDTLTLSEAAIAIALWPFICISYAITYFKRKRSVRL